MGPRDAGVATLALAAFVFVSSLLGLSGIFLFSQPGEAFGFMFGIWQASLVADAMFTLGTIGAGVMAFGFARRGGWGIAVAIVAGAIAHWAVYGASFLLLPETVSEHDRTQVVDAFGFVASWGWGGLLFATLAPPLAALAWERATASRGA